MNAVVISWYWFLIVSLFVFLIGMFFGVLIEKKKKEKRILKYGEASGKNMNFITMRIINRKEHKKDITH